MHMLTRDLRSPLLAAITWAGALPVADAHQAAAAEVLYGNDEMWIVAGLFFAGVLYTAGILRLWQHAGRVAGVSPWRAASFALGLAVLAVALVSPLDKLGTQLFSMHMLQHELLMLAAAPLLVAGMPIVVFLWAFSPSARTRIAAQARSGTVRAVWLSCTHPLAAWSLHAAVLWIWHAPDLFQASLLDDKLHAIQHLAFVISALMFWTALLGLQSAMRRSTAVLYILTTMIHTGMLGALLTFSPHAWYPVYAGRTVAWGLSLLEDQQLGGLIMWVPAGFILLFACLAVAASAIYPAWARRAWK